MAVEMNPETGDQPWFSRASFEGLTDHQAELLVYQRLADSSLPENFDLAIYHARLQHDLPKERAEARQYLRIYLLRLALGISGKYQPLVESLPRAVEAIDSAIEKWDPSSGFSLGTYGSWFIRQAVTKDRTS